MTSNQLSDAADALRCQARATHNTGHRERLTHYADACEFLATGDKWFLSLVAQGAMAMELENSFTDEEAAVINAHGAKTLELAGRARA